MAAYDFLVASAFYWLPTAGRLLPVRRLRLAAYCPPTAGRLLAASSWLDAAATLAAH